MIIKSPFNHFHPKVKTKNYHLENDSAVSYLAPVAVTIVGSVGGGKRNEQVLKDFGSTL